MLVRNHGLGALKVATGGKLAELTDPSAVKAALAEFKQIGRDAFLEAYGFRQSNTFFVYDSGVAFDSKPIAASAYGHQFGRQRALHYDDFSGGAPVARTLNDLGFRIVNWTSPKLKASGTYTRDDLRKLFSIEDATLNNGVFRPRNTNSVWLFVTLEKTSDRTQYRDHFEGDLLHWQGQTAGRTDRLIKEHEAAGDELLVFSRQSKRTKVGGGFDFEGQFRYIKHSGSSPTNFVLQRSNFHLKIGDGAVSFDPNSIQDGRTKILAEVYRRQGQPKFRRDLIRAYEGRCAITGCTVEALLEAAHVRSYLGPETNHTTNGLLLRADIHTLFDLGLITVSPGGTVEIVPSLIPTEYRELAGKMLRMPVAEEDRVSPASLEWHRRHHGLYDRANSGVG